MSEDASIGSEPRSDRQYALTEALKNRFLETFNQQITEKDIRDSQNIPPTQTLTEFFYKKLCFNRSLQEEAFNRLADYVPAPISTRPYREIQKMVEAEEGGGIFDPNEEMAIRNSLFPEAKDFFPEFQSPIPNKEVDKFSIEILESVDRESRASIDPKEVTGNLNLYERVLKLGPILLNIDGQYHFALAVPDLKRELPFPFPFKIPDPIKGYLIVTDPDIEHKLAEEVYSNPKILRHFMANTLLELQSEKTAELEQPLGELLEKKSKAIEAKVEAINKPIRSRAFDLLLQDTIEARKKDREIGIIYVLGNPYPNIIANGKRFHVQAEQNTNTLVFRWKDSWRDKKTGEETIQDFEVLVRKDQNDNLEFGIKGESGQIKWTKKPKYYSAADYVPIFFDAISVWTEDQEEELGDSIQVNLDRNTIETEMLKSTSSSDFFNKLRQLHPKNDVFIGTKLKIGFHI